MGLERLKGQEVDEVDRMEEENKRIREEIEQMEKKYSRIVEFARENNLDVLTWVSSILWMYTFSTVTLFSCEYK